MVWDPESAPAHRPHAAPCTEAGCQDDALIKLGRRWLCRAHYESRVSQDMTRWLVESGIIREDMTTGERMKACAAYRLSLGDQTGKPSRDWAEKLRARELAGESLLPIQREAWREVLGRKPVLLDVEDD